MKSCTFNLVVIVVSLFGSQLFAAEEEGWVRLFDGKSLDGWVQKNGTATYRVEDNTIIGKTSEGSPNSFLCTEKLYDDFELEFEVRVDGRLNSGVQIRSKTKDVAEGEGRNNQVGRVYGPQVEIEASPGLAGFIYGEATGRGWLSAEERRESHEWMKNGEWNHFRVIAKGPRIQTWINGHAVADLNDEEALETHPKGFIGLQVHGIPRDAGPYEVAWRNLKLREL